MNFQQVEFVTSFGRLDQLPPSQGVEIVFSGRSNVGKSSMINRIFNRKQLARVSSTPGKTATINFFRVGEAYFVDLPGYGYAKVGKTEQRRWGELIGGYFAQDREIGLVFQLIDLRHPPSRDDRMMIDFLVEQELPFVLVLTKQDKLSAKQQQERLSALQKEIPYADQITMIPFSSQTGEGVETIRGIIQEIAEGPSGPEPEG